MNKIIMLSLILCCALGAFAQSPEAWQAYEKARKHYVAKSYDAAVPYLQEAVEHSPDFIDAYHLLAVCQDERGEVKEALSNYEKVIAKKDIDEKVWYNIGRLYAADKQNDKAMECFEKALAINPNYKKPQYQITLLEAEKDNTLDGAASDVSADANKDSDVSLYAVVNLYKEKKYQKALDESYKIRASDVNAKVFYMRGVCYEKLKDKVSALENYYNAIGFDNTYTDAYTQLGFLNYNKGEYEEAHKHFSKAAELNADDHELMKHAGSAAYYARRYEEAISLLTNYLENVPKDGKAHYILSAVYVETNEDELADKHLALSANAGYAKAVVRMENGEPAGNETRKVSVTEETTTIIRGRKRTGEYEVVEGKKMTKKERRAARKRAKKKAKGKG